MRTIVSSGTRRTFIELLLDSRDSGRSLIATGLALLTFGAAACSTESNSSSSTIASSSEPGGSSSVGSTGAPSGNASAPSGSLSASALVPTASASGTEPSATETATAFPGLTAVGSATGPGSTATATATGSGGSAALDPMPPGIGGTTETSSPTLDEGDPSNPNSALDETGSTAASESTLSDVGPGQEAGPGAQGAAATSCADDGPGRSTCGLNDDESCCDSPLVEGGTFFRSYENVGDGPTAQADEATITSFRLDKYEVSVGRFRRFVEYLAAGGSAPEAGSGKHTHLNAGQGLADSGAPDSFEPGWDAAWNEHIPSGEGAAAQWQSVLATGVNGSSGCGLYGTWTEQPGDNEESPITCTSWYESYAFCIWDGGFLPSEAEWKYAAAGGSEQRMYPWGTTALGSDNEYAIYDCCYPDGECSTAAGSDTCTGAVNASPVGFASLGASRYGQLDLIGNVFEWGLDRFGDYVSPCEDCALLSAATADRLLPGAGFHTSLGLGSSILYSWNRASIAWSADAFRGDYAVGLRCARSP